MEISFKLERTNVSTNFETKTTDQLYKKQN